MSARVHILGASGSGTTSLASRLCRRHGWAHFDTDDFFWIKTDPPYTEIRPTRERTDMLGAALAGASGWALSGSLCGWGDIFIPQFDLVVFLEVPTEIRIRRLTAREAGRYGPGGIDPGGVMHDAFIEFMAWTAQYDAGAPTMRSRALHEAWLAKLPCPVLRLDGTQTEAELADAVAARLSPLGRQS